MVTPFANFRHRYDTCHMNDSCLCTSRCRWWLSEQTNRDNARFMAQRPHSISSLVVISRNYRCLLHSDISMMLYRWPMPYIWAMPYKCLPAVSMAHVLHLAHTLQMTHALPMGHALQMTTALDSSCLTDYSYLTDGPWLCITDSSFNDLNKDECNYYYTLQIVTCLTLDLSHDVVGTARAGYMPGPAG